MKEFDAKILDLCKAGGIEAMLEMERLFEQALLQDQHNIGLLLRFAILVQEVPLADHVKSISILETILTIDTNNPIALLILAYVYYHNIGIIDESLYQQLISNPTNDPEIKSMLKYCASWFYVTRNDNHNVEKMLIESIDACQAHTYNYKKLAELRLRQNQPAGAKQFIKKALINVKKIYTNYTDYINQIDVQQFLGERIKGIYLTDSNYYDLKMLEAEAVLKEQLCRDPLDIDLLLGLAITEDGYFSAGYEKHIATLQKILNLEPDNVTALLILAYMSYHKNKRIDESLFKKLITIKTNDPEINAMRLYVASWFYAGKDAKKQEELLRQSIGAYPYHVRNYFELATLCEKQNKVEEAKIFNEKAMNNIVKVYSFLEYTEKLADIENFLNRAIKGTYISNSNFKRLQKNAEKRNIDQYSL